MSYFGNREAAVQYVANRLRTSKQGSVLTMIIGRDKSGDFYAHTVIDELWALTEPLPLYSEQPMNTSPVPTPDG